MDNWFELGFFFNELLIKYDNKGDFKTLISVLGVVEESVPMSGAGNNPAEKFVKGFTNSNTRTTQERNKGIISQPEEASNKLTTNVDRSPSPDLVPTKH